ncbi:MAG: hypothetical protein WB770_06075 [Acidimicrobiales bacterium]
MAGSPRLSASSSRRDRREDARETDRRPSPNGESREVSKWWTRRAIGLHVALGVTFPGFLALGWWQLERALGGNTLSWAYTFEWPFFAGYAVYVWWRIIHEDETTIPDVARRAPSLFSRYHRRSDDDGSADAELAEYNAHLAALHAYDREKHNLDVRNR